MHSKHNFSALIYVAAIQMESAFCRPHCAACCIAPSITSPLPGMPNGKPAGVPCIQLDDELRCKVFGTQKRPAFCGGLQPSAEMCGESREGALAWLTRLEQATCPRV
jgi:Fe-S-cluster containining protein